MHSSIMAIVTLPLIGCLRTLEKQHPKRDDITSIVKVLRPHGNFRRGPFSPCQQMPIWTASPGGMKMAVRTAFRSLINWSLQLTSMNPAQLPPPYNHRLFLIAERALGASAVLKILLAEIKDQTENPAGAAAVAIDIATALICAPKTENSPIEYTWPTSPVPTQVPHQNRRLNLREALTLTYEHATDIIKNDATLAESVVRLYRRVEAQSAISSVALPDMSAQLPAPDVQQMLESIAAGSTQTAAAVQQQQQPALDLGQDAATLANLDVSGAEGMQIDFGADADDMSGLLGGGGGLNPEDDVFGDLDWTNMEGMDMEDGF
jgi:mediator of RNA polymerase II transcription subunit 5